MDRRSSWPADIHLKTPTSATGPVPRRRSSSPHCHCPHSTFTARARCVSCMQCRYASASDFDTYIHSTHMTTSVLVLPCMQPYTITSASGLGFPDQLRAARVDVPDLILPPWLAVPSKRQLPIRPGLCRTSPDHAGGDLDCSARACPWSTTRGSPPMGSRSCAGLSSIIHIGSRRLPYHSTHLNTTLLPYSMCNFTNTRGSPQGGYETSGSPGKSREFR